MKYLGILMLLVLSATVISVQSAAVFPPYQCDNCMDCCDKFVSDTVFNNQFCTHCRSHCCGRINNIQR
ncbi:hypothetical protein XELAEV_18030561mg [Xenopus laevis]|uniref:Uncharacterized protein n=1 Tax=Xenopus laevis TaxID=8355 RepID=A0A974CLC8_XENLA|nr:hypothetical protein XELAEV_18030561mg [Xenopus laevis]